MTNIEHAATRYVEARKAHSGQAEAYRALSREVHAALAQRFPRLPHTDPKPGILARLRRSILGVNHG